MQVENPQCLQFPLHLHLHLLSLRFLHLFPYRSPHLSSPRYLHLSLFRYLFLSFLPQRCRHLLLFLLRPPRHHKLHLHLQPQLRLLSLPLLLLLVRHGLGTRHLLQQGLFVQHLRPHFPRLRSPSTARSRSLRHRASSLSLLLLAQECTRKHKRSQLSLPLMLRGAYLSTLDQV